MAIGYKKNEPMDYLLDMQDQDQKNIFDTSPAKTAPVTPGSVGRDKPGLQQVTPSMQHYQNLPGNQQFETGSKDYYVNPVTGENTGMTFDAYYDQWLGSSAGQHFGGDYKSYIDYLQHASEQTGFDTVWDNASFLSPPGSSYWQSNTWTEGVPDWLGDLNQDGVIDDGDCQHLWGYGYEGQSGHNLDEPSGWVWGGIGGGEGLAPGQGYGNMPINPGQTGPPGPPQSGTGSNPGQAGLGVRSMFGRRNPKIRR